MPGYRYRYMISDSQNEPLARAILETPPNSKIWNIQILDDDLEQVLEHEIINLISLNADHPDMTGRILSSDHVNMIKVEPVIPITSHPVILRARILRLRPSNSNIPLYSAKFLGLIHDEEVIVREAVFSQQIANRGARK